MNLPAEKQALLDTLIPGLAAVPGVEALALGGSYARGTAHPGSDLDIALYYREDAPLDVEAVRRIAAEISIQGEPVVTDLYGWGPWVNGGAWIYTAAGKVDFLYRSLDQVQRTIDAARQGKSEHDFEQQPVFGFYSVTYLGETLVCRPLHDPAGHLERLKRQVQVYPPALKERTVSGSLWLTEFSLLHARAYAAAGDVYAAAGTLARCASFLVQALFALNEVYFINDKTAMREIAAFPLAPAGFVERLQAILGCPGRDPESLARSAEQMEALRAETAARAAQASTRTSSI